MPRNETLSAVCNSGFDHLGTPFRSVPKPPLLRWAGGKRWLVERHPELFDLKNRRLVEPFVGGGAVFFSSDPLSALLADSNRDLIETYVTVANQWSEVQEALKKHQFKHSESHYYKVRNSKPKTNVTKAARFIYLNRTCWNGLYRVNRSGVFNVPKGTKDAVLLPGDDFKGISEALKRAEIKSQDFQTTLNSAKESDFVFIDPPYTIKHNNNGFVKYNEGIFSWADQIRLRDCVMVVAQLGAKVVITNADHPSVKKLYKGIGIQKSIDRASLISGTNKGRGRYAELLIVIN